MNSKNPYSMYARSTNVTPQSEPIPNSNQVPNNGGGFGWQITDWQRLERFLILGSEGGTYYTSERKLTAENAKSVLACIQEDGLRVVNTVAEISDSGRAAKNDPALFVLALCAAAPDERTRKAALSALWKVARTATMLFQFVEMVQEFRGWGRSLSRAVAEWYDNKNADAVAYQMIKYRQRNGWTHRDLLRLSHPYGSEIHNALYQWVTDGYPDQTPEGLNEVKIVQGYLKVQQAKNAKEAARIVKEYNLPREALPTQFLNSPEVWEALLPTMPMTALIRNLGNMGSVGLLVPGSFGVIQTVVDKLTNQEYLHKSRIHPLNVLIALKTYDQGRGFLGSNNWNVVPQVVDALNDAFYASFANVEPTGKRFLIGIDVSGSMSSAVSGVRNLSCAEAAGAMAMTVMRTEQKYSVMAFHNGMMDVGISARQNLNEVLRKISNINYGGTDCSLPMQYALKHKMEVDMFVVITDNETNHGYIHPSQALVQYRQQTGINAKLAVLAMSSGEFSIADPDDAGMLDCIGFDSSVPHVLAEFAKM